MKSTNIIFIILFYFITLSSYSQGEFLIEIDGSTGSFLQIGNAINGITWVYPYIRGYDETHGTYIFQGGASLVDHLYSIDVTNGSIISNPYFAPFGTSVREPKYDDTKDSLYGLYWNSSLSQFFLASINPVTGLYTTINTTPIAGLTSTFQGGTAYDAINHRYFVVDNNQLFSINSANGTLISSPNILLGSGEQLLHFCYNNSLNVVNGLIQNSNTPQLCYLISINITTGVVTRIGNGFPFGIGGGSSTIDKINQRFIYTYTTGGSTFYVTTVDIASGNVISNKLIPLDPSDNIHSIAYDNVKHKLFGIQWDADKIINTTVIPQIQENSSLVIPNIFTPNNDGVNDLFRIITKNITTINCKIYNRWGILIHELTKINESWDGNTMQGLQCITGVYFYTVIALGKDGKEYNEKGEIQIMN